MLPLALGFQDEFDCVAEGAVAAGVRGDVVGCFADVGPGVLDGDGEASGAHGGEVDDVVTDKGGFFGGEVRLCNDLQKDAALVLNALADELQFEVVGAESDGFGNAFGDETGPDAGEASERDGGAVMGVKAFGLDQGLALQAESALAGVMGGAFFLVWREYAGRGGGSGKDEELAIGEDAVDIEEEKLDFAGAGAGRERRHRGN